MSSWLASIQLGGDIDVGATMNPENPENGINFGHLFTDKANQIVLNQFALWAGRAPDPKAGAFDLGFKVWGMYGLDSQFTHFLGLGDHPTTGRNSFDLVEGDLEAHAGFLTPGGIDAKLGFFPSPMGYESIDPTQNLASTPGPTSSTSACRASTPASSPPRTSTGFSTWSSAIRPA